MSHFFKVKTLEDVWNLARDFPRLGTEFVHLSNACGRILGTDLKAQTDLPGFSRATMDGYAIKATSAFGASESNPALLNLIGSILMGEEPKFIIKPGQAVRIATGGMLPQGADAVVMIEYTQEIDQASVEIYRSVAPLQNVISASEDFAKNQTVLSKGKLIRPQEIGLAAALGIAEIEVFQRPRVGIISTGDEVIPIDEQPRPGRIRDINSYSLAGFIKQEGGIPVQYGIVRDNADELKQKYEKAVQETDILLISGGSSVGTKDYTLEVLSSLPQTKILVHGISISPGKPTILAKHGDKPIWGLPGQVVSAMIVLKIAVMPFLYHQMGYSRPKNRFTVQARLSRNIASTQGRRDFIRVKLEQEGKKYLARPILGKSGLINTMINADGLLEISENVEGLEKDTEVEIILL